MKAAQIPAITEKAFQAHVTSLALTLGYRVYHTRFSFQSAPGYPDLHMVKGQRSVFAELKSDKGRVTAAQAEWLDALREAGHEAYLWRPDDWDEIVRVLQ